MIAIMIFNGKLLSNMYDVGDIFGFLCFNQLYYNKYMVLVTQHSTIVVNPVY